MMLATAFALGLALPAIPAAAEKRCFADMMCTIPLAKGDYPHEWPFSLDAGELSCVTVADERAVFFGEENDEIGKVARQVIVSTNPVALLVTVEDRELYAPYDTLETLVKRLAPYQDIGLAICPEQKAPQKDI